MPEINRNKLTEVEKKIISARLEGKSICQLTDESLRVAADQIILKSAYIVGCPTPETEFYSEGLAKEMIEYLNEFGFSELTLNEIILAIRLNTKGGLKYPSGTDVEKIIFSGTCFNIDFLSKILSNYMTFRNILDRKIENFIDGY